MRFSAVLCGGAKPGAPAGPDPLTDQFLQVQVPEILQRAVKQASFAIQTPSHGIVADAAYGNILGFHPGHHNEFERMRAAAAHLIGNKRKPALMRAIPKSGRLIFEKKPESMLVFPSQCRDRRQKLTDVG